jgi:hypothetical protein
MTTGTDGGGGPAESFVDGPRSSDRFEDAGDEAEEVRPRSAAAVRSAGRLDESDEDDEEDEDEPALQWPLGLRILPPGPEVAELRGEVDALVKLALRQAESGKVRPQLVKRIHRDLATLERLLEERADRLPASGYTIREARRFLKDLNDMVAAL